MTISPRYLFAILAVSFAAHTADAGLFNKENTIGAAIGGIAGGIIGHQSDHRTEGAILGGVAGYAIGSVIRDEKDGSRRDRQEPAYILIEEPAPTPEPEAWQPAPAPQFTKSEEQQLLLQSSQLFSVK